MDCEALPQRPSARRRLRAQCQNVQTPEEAICEPTPSGCGHSGCNKAAVVSDTDVQSAGPAVGHAITTLYGNGAEDETSGAASSTLKDLRPELAPSAVSSYYDDDDREEPPGTRGCDVEEDGEALPAYRTAAVGAFKFEYLDHTADVQLHAWGRNLTEAFENVALAMFNYMSPLEHVRPRKSRKYRAEGHDLPSLLYGFMDELLFVFSTELFLAASVTIASFDRTNYIIEAEGWGETFDRAVHEVGTEVKAITYSAMSIAERDDDAEVFVIVDI